MTGLQIFRVYAMYHSSQMILFTLAGFATLMSAVVVVSNAIVASSAGGWDLGRDTSFRDKLIINLWTVGYQHGVANTYRTPPGGTPQYPLHWMPR